MIMPALSSIRFGSIDFTDYAARILETIRYCGQVSIKCLCYAGTLRNIRLIPLVENVSVSQKAQRTGI